MRVLRIYHGGRIAAHRRREQALVDAGLDLTLVAPSGWPEGAGGQLDQDAFKTIELPVAREGDVNRHAYRSLEDLVQILEDLRPDVLDVHEEPFSVASRQWLAAAPPNLPVVMYTAQNVDKRLPPPFAQYEQAAYRRVAALYPCSAQAASVARGKGFAGLIDVLPLGYDDAVFSPGTQSLDDDELVLGLFGRLVPEKGITDAVEILERVNAARPARLVVVGRGPEQASARDRASALGVADRLELVPWQETAALAASYRSAHVVLVPSRPTETWVEQFGRVIVEAQASGAVVAGYASGAIPEVAGAAAILTGPGDVSRLADRVIGIATDPTAYAELRERGIELSRSRTWARVAERQAALYRHVVEGGASRIRSPASPRKRRAAARAEFGATAATAAGPRPFALPILRRGGPLAAGLGWVIDEGAELLARARRR